MIRDDLEGSTRRLLQGLPPLKAPAGLEGRVQTALAQRAALPWWRRSFGDWPSGARLGFVLVSLGIVALTVQLGTGARLSAAPAEWLGRAESVVAGVGGLFALPARLVAPGWLTALLGVGALLYTALFGLGAALYRLFYLRPLPEEALP